jgi:DNA-binding response OmpR family regulator
MNAMKDPILVVDDERMLVETISYNLGKEGYEVLCAYDGEAALEIAQSTELSLIVLDLMLPKLSGWEVCRALRQSQPAGDVPILMLTARGEESDKILGLELGADDYLVKPFGMRELLARIKALLRRAAPPAAPATALLNVGPVQMDTERHEVRLTGRDGQSSEVKLSLKEFELLRALLEHAGRAMAREILLARVWGDDFYGDERTLDVHIRWLREKIEVLPSQPQHLLTVRGVGYKFKA